MKSFGITDRGKVRRDNQDSFLIERIDEKDCLIAVLCDGMGGEKAGNIASDLAAKTYVGELSQKMKITRQKKPDVKAMMIQACHLANHMIYGYSCFDTDYTGMGTTMVSAVVVGDDVYVLNVGDSRAYRITRRKMVQITRDHSLVQDMVDRGEITPSRPARTRGGMSSPAPSAWTRTSPATYSSPGSRAATCCCSAPTGSQTCSRTARSSSSPRRTPIRSRSAAR